MLRVSIAKTIICFVAALSCTTFASDCHAQVVNGENLYIGSFEDEWCDFAWADHTDEGTGPTGSYPGSNTSVAPGASAAALFSNDPADSAQRFLVPSGNPSLTVCELLGPFDGIHVRASIVDLDFDGSPVSDNKEIRVGSSYGYSRLSLNNVFMNVVEGIEVTEGAELIIDQDAVVSAGTQTEIVDGRMSVWGFLDPAGINVSLGAELRLVQGGTILSSSTTTNRGRISGSGSFIDRSRVINSGGEINISDNETLQFWQLDNNARGTIDVISGEVRIEGPFTNSVDAVITGRNGVLRFADGMDNDGAFALSFGTSDVFGDIDNSSDGLVVVSGNSQATFYDDVINNGTFRVSAGSTMVLFGDLSGAQGITGGGTVFLEGDLSPGNSPALVTFNSDLILSHFSNLEIELGGLAKGTEYDSISIQGGLELNGSLNVVFIDDFSPASGDSFQIIDATAMSGFFQDVALPELNDGLTWVVEQAADTINLSVVETTVTPDAFNITRGTFISGGIDELQVSDNLDLVARRRSADIQSRVFIEVKAESHVPNPSSFEFTLEASVFARGPVIQTIEFWNYSTNTWEPLESRNASRFSDLIIVVSGSGDLSRFVEMGTRCVRARVRFQSTNPRQQFSTNVDQMVWTIE